MRAVPRDNWSELARDPFERAKFVKPIVIAKRGENPDGPMQLEPLQIADPPKEVRRSRILRRELRFTESPIERINPLPPNKVPKFIAAPYHALRIGVFIYLVVFMTKHFYYPVPAELVTIFICGILLFEVVPYIWYGWRRTLLGLSAAYMLMALALLAYLGALQIS